MNFLSHYYHELPSDDPYYICGVVFPDILSNFSKRHGQKIRLHPDKILTTQDIKSESLKRGVQQHYFVDGFFHDSDYFNEYTGAVDELINKLGFSAIHRRQFAFSHVFLEIMMDRCLLVQDITIADSLYAALDKVDLGILDRFLSTNTKLENTQPLTEHFDHFRTLKFIYHYADSNRFTGIMNSINQSLGNPPFTNEDNQQMRILINDMEQILLKATFPNFVND